jgi:hypothetical protein
MTYMPVDDVCEEIEAAAAFRLSRISAASGCLRVAMRWLALLQVRSEYAEST